jgi:NAD+-dependent protein deacetylase sirtuin 6
VYHDYDLKSLGLKKTGRRCKEAGCSGWMCDAMVDWDQALPDDELGRAEEHSHEADLSICLGTSLRVSPANELPLFAKRTPNSFSMVTNFCSKSFCGF